MEVYITTIFAGFFFLQFFLGLKTIKCDWFYNWGGKNIAFYIYILHILAGTILKHYYNFTINYWYSLLVFVVSIVLYEIGFFTIKLIKHLIKNIDKNIVI